MSQRKILFEIGEYYHIYNRGNSKQIIFRDDNDKIRFVQLLSIMNQQERKRIDESSLRDSFERKDDPLLAIGAYVLMDNHFHILVKETSENGTTKFMQKVCTAYAMYFNKKYDRRGGLFEGNFKAKFVDSDIYLQYLYAYIHLNPAKMLDKNWKNAVLRKNKDLTEFIKRYSFSSFHDYCAIKRPENSLLTIKEFPLYFKTSKDFIESILRWLPLESKIVNK